MPLPTVRGAVLPATAIAQLALHLLAAIAFGLYRVANLVLGYVHLPGLVADLVVLPAGHEPTVLGPAAAGLVIFHDVLLPQAEAPTGFFGS